jgi:hypothetical protein
LLISDWREYVTQKSDEERQNMVVIDVMSMLKFTLVVCPDRDCCGSVAIAEKSGVCRRVEKTGEKRHREF